MSFIASTSGSQRKVHTEKISQCLEKAHEKALRERNEEAFERKHKRTHEADEQTAKKWKQEMTKNKHGKEHTAGDKRERNGVHRLK